MSPRPLRVSTRPSLPPHVPLGIGRRGRLPAPLDGDRVRFFLKGRTAMWHAVRALGLTTGDEVLVPAYQCGAELDAIVRADAAVRFYRVDRNARADVEDLTRAAGSRTRAVVVTHYFGFPQPDLQAIAELCRARGLYLIEDCAHALYSRDREGWLGTAGNLAIFSMWKTLPAPDGGAVVVNDPTLHVAPAAVVPPSNGYRAAVRWSIDAYAYGRPSIGYRVLRKLGFDVATIVADRVAGPAPPLATAASRASPDPTPRGGDPHMTFDEQTADWGISAISSAVLRYTDPTGVVERRRRNFAFLLAELAGARGISVVRDELPAGVCPLWFPITVDDPESLHAHLLQHGVSTDLPWNTFHERFPRLDFTDAAWLKTHVVALPIHQMVSRSALAATAAAVRHWRARA